MNRLLLIGACLLLSVRALAYPRQDRVQPPLRSTEELEAWLNDPGRPKIRLHPLPPIAPPIEPSVSDADAQHILELIAQLATVSAPDYGLSGTMSGWGFAPVPGSEHAGAMLLANGSLKPSPVVLKLVKRGPRALPFLLKHLDDATPTQLTIQHDRVFGGMVYGHELSYNEANPFEQMLRSRRRDRSAASLQRLPTTYQVKVGDVCFNIIGQIVGRSYRAVRYQPTAMIIINSPVADAALAQEVRGAWSSSEPVCHLFQSLVSDYSCRGVYSGYSLDGWGKGSDLQCEAAMRLLYYFPQQSAALVAVRLHSLKVERTGRIDGGANTEKEMAAWTEREIANGVDAKDFIKAVAWCPDPRIRGEMLHVFRNATEVDLLLAALRGLPPAQWPLVRRRMGALLRKQPPAEDGLYGEGYNLLVALREFGGDKAQPFYRRYLFHGSPQRCISVCEALRETRGQWDTKFLLPLLADRRRSPGYNHEVYPHKESPLLPIRVCDEAAEVISLHRGGVEFNMVGSFAQLDRQIQAIRQRAGR